MGVDHGRPAVNGHLPALFASRARENAGMTKSQWQMTKTAWHDVQELRQGVVFHWSLEIGHWSLKPDDSRQFRE
jgi:hypothetical protein